MRSDVRRRTTLIVVAAFAAAIVALYAYASVEPDGIRFGRASEGDRARDEVALDRSSADVAAATPEAVALGVPLDDAALAAPSTTEPPLPLPGFEGAILIPGDDAGGEPFGASSLILRLRTPITRPTSPTTTATNPPSTTPPSTTPPSTTPPSTTPPSTEPPSTEPPPTEPPPTEPPPTEPPSTEPLLELEFPLLPFLPDITLF
jgi:hypothetical protein